MSRTSKRSATASGERAASSRAWPWPGTCWSIAAITRTSTTLSPGCAPPPPSAATRSPAMAADRWVELEAAAWPGELGQRIYTSRLLGRDPGLVMHGGGNTSVKTTATNLFGEPEPVIHIKGSGWDL